MVRKGHLRVAAPACKIEEYAGAGSRSQPKPPEGELHRLVTLAVLAGAFIGLGAVYFLTGTTDVKGGYGSGQFLGGIAFSLGLVLVVQQGQLSGPPASCSKTPLGSASMAMPAYRPSKRRVKHHPSRQASLAGRESLRDCGTSGK